MVFFADEKGRPSPQGKFIQFGRTSLSAFRISPVTPKLEKLVSLLDGKHDLLALAKRSGLSVEDVKKTVQGLSEKGILEDAGQTPPFSPSYAERFSRQFSFFSLYEKEGIDRYEAQRQLAKARVAVLGLGAGGAHDAMFLSLAGVGEIIGVDFDEVELSNILKQRPYTTADVGVFKGEALKRRIRELNPGTKLTTYKKKLRSPQDVKQIIRGADYVVHAFDRPWGLAQAWTNGACQGLKIPYSGAALVDNLGFVGPVVIPGRTSCAGCWSSNLEPPKVFKKLNDRLAWGSVPPITSIVNGIHSLEIIKCLTGLGSLKLLNRALQIDFFALSFSFVDFPPSPKCPYCKSWLRKRK